MPLSAITACSISPLRLNIPINLETDQTTPSDEALVDSARMGDADAFGQLVQRHYRFCFSKAFSILRDFGDAEDEVQNACTKAWTHLFQYQGDGPFGGWLNRIVSNQCLMRIRERKNRRMLSVDEVIDSECSFRLEVIDQRALPDEAVGNDEVSRLVFKEIHCVPFLLREVLVMRELRQQTMPDIATHLGISIAAAKSRLMRARNELKRRLVKHHGKKGCGTLLQKSGLRKATYVRAN